MDKTNRIRMRNAAGKALPLVLLFCLAAGAYARNLYVDRSHPQASDANPGTEAQPWLTMGNAAAKAVAGDTVYIKAGTYPETRTVSMVNSGTSAAPITFRNYGSDRVIIDGASMASGSHVVRWKSAMAHYIVFSGLEFRGGKDTGLWVEGNYNTIKDCKVYNTASTGILVRRGTHNTFSRLEIHHTGWNGIDLEDSEYSTIEECYIHDNPEHHAVNIFPAPGTGSFSGNMRGIVVRNNRLTTSNKGMYLRYISDMEISGNLITDNDEYGIFFHNESGRASTYSSSSRVLNNTITGNAWEGIYNQCASGLTIRYNLFRNDREREMVFSVTGGHSIDYNAYDPGSGSLFSWSGSTYSLQGFRGLGFEQHGVAGGTVPGGGGIATPPSAPRNLRVLN